MFDAPEMVVTDDYDGEYPVVTGELDKKGYIVIPECEVCGGKHRHSKPAGDKVYESRVPHCSLSLEEKPDNYVIEIQDRVT